MPIHERDGKLYIVDTEAIWRHHMKLHRQEQIARWCFVLSVALVLGLLAGLFL